MTDECPACGNPGCDAGRLMRERWAIATGLTHDQINAAATTSRTNHDREHWRRIHDRETNPTPPPSPEDIALRAYVAKRPCCG